MDAKTELVSETGAIKHAALTLFGYYCLRRNKNTGLCFPKVKKTAADTGIPITNVSMLNKFLEDVGWIEIFKTGVIRPLKGFVSDEEIIKFRLKNILINRTSVLIIRTNILIIRTLFKGSLNQPIKPAHLTSDSANSLSANSANAPDDKKITDSPPSPSGFLGKSNLPAGKPTPSKASAGKPVDERINHPAVQMVKEITGRYPPKTLWDKLIREIKASPDQKFFQESWEIWLSVGGNPMNYEKWLFEPNRAGLAPEIFGQVNGNLKGGKPPPDWARVGAKVETVPRSLDDEHLRAKVLEFIEIRRNMIVRKTETAKIPETDKKNWTDILAALERKLNKQIFDAWFCPIQFAGCDKSEKILYLQASQVNREWVETYYADTISQTLDELNLSGYALDWTVEENELNELLETSALESLSMDYTSENWKRFVEIYHEEKKRFLTDDKPES